MDSELVKDRIDLVELISASTEVHRVGSRFNCRCPWHEDKKPSLSIEPVRKIWKCWVCDIGGDCYDWVMRKDGLSFAESLAKLADRAGVILTNNRGEVSKTREFYDAIESAASYFEAELRKSPESIAYLKSRSITGESAKRFRLGFSPKGVSLSNALGIDQDVLVNAGLSFRTESGKVLDRFAGRLTIPIVAVNGRVVSFGARLVPGIKLLSPAKYLNGAESAVFSKKLHLFGLDQAGQSIKKEKIAMVMEGYTDVIIAHQYGITTAVACLGTAFGETHLKKLRQYTELIAIVLDGDEAGQKTADKILPMLAGTSAKIVEIPDGKDPADYLV